VKTYLATAGIEAARLTARGFGAKQPIAGNDSELGRAQNRRVELVRE
jgi:outer membrane protein OmpA-like peptidoglycan-associated protein